jgi:beta-exotoxin I transport system permease protein
MPGHPMRALVLARHSFRRTRPIVIGMAIVLAAFQFLLTQVAVFLMRNQAFGMLSSLIPGFIRSMGGASIVAFMSFGGVVALGYFHPFVIASLLGLAIAIGTEPAAEVETRFADLTMARPIARHDAITRTVVVLVVTIASLVALMTAATWTGLVCCTPATAERPAFALIRSLAITLGAIVLCWGGVAVAVASGARRRATAAGITGLATLAAYLIDYLGRIWDPLRLIGRLSPFHYFEPMTLISGGAINLSNIAVLAAIAAAAIAIAYVRFARRDL